jgi:tryptophan-rich sensory protein
MLDYAVGFVRLTKTCGRDLLTTMPNSSVRLRVVPSRVNPWLALVGWLLLTMVAGAVGAIASAKASQFYVALDRPAWAPPAGVFGPVWTLLYIAMAVAAWLVWRERGFARARGALGLFILQLGVNALWSWLFFGWHHGGWAFADILLLMVLILATMVAFARIRLLAAWLLAPYLLWVCFATALNYSVWQRNLPLL